MCLEQAFCHVWDLPFENHLSKTNIRQLEQNLPPLPTLDEKQRERPSKMMKLRKDNSVDIFSTIKKQVVMRAV